MKKEDRDKLRTKEVEELRSELALIRKELSKLRLEKAQNKLKDARSIFKKRKEIAFLLTILREKELISRASKK